MKLLKGHSLPTTMQGLATAGKQGVTLVERPVPSPGPGQVLLEMQTSPINPSDVMFLDDVYEVKKPLGTIAGFEGAGTVVAAGGGLMSRYLLGRDVACAAVDGDGTWADYVVVDAMKCAPIDRGVDRTQAAMMLSNPMTAVVLIETGRSLGHRAFVQNAAAGALGKMIVRLCARYRLPIVNLVRRPEQAAMLKAIGAEHVVIDGPDAASELRAICERLGVSCAFDAVAGPGTQQLAQAIAQGGSVLVYGLLSGQPTQIATDTLIFRRLQVRGFTMYEWVENTSLLAKFRTLRAVQKRLGDDLRSEIRATRSLAEHADALALVRGSTSDGKVLFSIAKAS